MISVTIPVLSGATLEDTLRSLAQDSSEETEVILVCAQESSAMAALADRYGCTLIVAGQVGLLAARGLGHDRAHGEFELLMDETRSIVPGALRKAVDTGADLVAITEREVGDDVWSKLATLDKALGARISTRRMDPTTQRRVLPRFFRTKVLDAAFTSIRGKLGPEALARILHLDHDIIFYEAFKVSPKLALLREPLVLHRGDQTARGIWQKYARYGSSSRSVSDSPYHSLARHIHRGSYPILGWPALMPLWSLRAAAYFRGMLSVSGVRESRGFHV